MHLYYTGESQGEPTITFEKSQESIESTIKQFDEVVEKIQNHEFTSTARNRKSCLNCDMRYYCGKVDKQN
jgi:DNA helicase-2/ATP-dependent DNA helicase PcrA